MSWLNWTRTPKARLSTITGASNITGWMPPIEEIVDAVHSLKIPVAVDCAQLAPPPSAS